MRRSKRRLLPVLCVFTLAAAACGGDDDTTAPAEEPASEPAEEPASEPAEEPASEPAEEPASEPAEEPASEPAEEPAGEPIVIPAFLPLDGPGAPLGQGAANALELTTERINAAGGVNGRPIEIDIQNTESSPDRSAELFRQVVDESTMAVIGPVLSTNCSAVRPLAIEAQVTQYCMSGAPFTWDDQYFFSTYYDPWGDLGDLPGAWFQARGISEVACIASNDQSGDAYVGVFGARAPEYGITLTEERFEAGDPNADTQLTAAGGSDIQGIYSCASGGNLIPVLTSVQNLGLDAPVWVGGGSMLEAIAQAAKDILPSAGAYGSGSWVLVPDSIPDDWPNKDEIVDFATEYKARYGNSGDVVTLSGADALSMLVEAMRAGNETGTDIAKYLEGLTYQGLVTNYALSPEDHRGTEALGVVVRLTSDGGFEFVEQLDLN